MLESAPASFTAAQLHSITQLNDVSLPPWSDTDSESWTHGATCAGYAFDAGELRQCALHELKEVRKLVYDDCCKEWTTAEVKAEREDKRTRDAEKEQREREIRQRDTDIYWAARKRRERIKTCIEVGVWLGIIVLVLYFISVLGAARR